MRAILCGLMLLVPLVATAQSQLSFKSRELQEGKNYLGSLTAVLAVGESSGELAYQYDIKVPPGRGITPPIALAYSSHGRASEFGWGWELTLPVVERSDEAGVGGNAFRFRNGHVTSELVFAGSAAGGWEVWRERRETTFSRYYKNSSTNSWKILRTDGTRIELGTLEGSRRGTDTATFAGTAIWQTERMYDTHSNYAEYTYDRDTKLIRQIQYNGNSTASISPTITIAFAWGAHLSAGRSGYRSGFVREFGSQRLNSVTVTAPAHATGTSPALIPASSPSVKTHVFGYRAQVSLNNMFYLTSAGIAGFPATSFTYSDPVQPPGIADTRKVFGGTDPSFPRQLGLSETDLGSETTRTRRVFVDVTRDGRADLLEALPAGGFVLWRNVGTTLLARAVWPTLTATAVPLPEMGSLRVVQRTGLGTETRHDFFDLNGDGFPDIVYMTSGILAFCPGSRDGFGSCRAYGATAIATLRQERTPVANISFRESDMIDINGDGRPDAVSVFGNSMRIYYNIGSGFDSNFVDVPMPYCGSPIVPTCLGRTEDNASPDANRLLIADTRDINGDSLPDFLLSSGTGNLTVHFGTGRGFTTAGQTRTIPNFVGYAYQSGDGSFSNLADLVDMNADGLPDFVTFDCRLTNQQYQVRFNNGGVWDGQSITYQMSADPAGRLYERACLARSYNTISGNTISTYVSAATADMNGDGIPEFVSADRDPATLTTGYQLAVRELPYLAPRKMMSASSLNGNNVMTVGWGPLTGDLPYALHAPHSVSKQRTPLYTGEPSRLTMSTTTYSYTTPTFDEGARRFGGIQRVNATGDSFATSTETYYWTGFQRAGAIVYRETRNNSGGAAGASVLKMYEYVFDQLSPTRGHFRVTKINTIVGNSRQLTADTIISDDYGNVTRWTDRGDPSTNVDDIINISSFAVRDDASFIKSVVTEQSRTSQAGQMPRVRYYYDSSLTLGATPTYGALTRIERELANGQFAATSQTVDQVGNTMTATDEAGFTTSVVYDSTHRLYPVRSSDSIGTKHMSYHALTGAVADSCGPQYNGSSWNCYRSEVDVVGRVTAAYVPQFDGSTYSKALLYTVAYNENTYPISAIKTVRGQSRTIEYRDGFGSPTQLRVEDGEPGGGVSFRVHETAYDAHGLPQRVEVPRRESTIAFSHVDGGTQATLYTHDYLSNTIERLVHPRDGAQPTEFAVRIRRPDHVETIDEDGRTIRYYQDYFGQVTEVAREGGPPLGTVKTLLSYDVNGHVVRVTDPNSLITTWTRNLAGWPASIATPEGRQWSYQYNPRGQVTRVDEPDGSAITYGYDTSGRPSYAQSSSVPGTSRGVFETMTWCSTTTTQIGRLCSETVSTSAVAGMQSMRYNYTYNSEGQVANHQLVVTSGFTESIQYSYTIGGRLSSIAYPNGMLFNYGYYLDDSVKSVTYGSSDLATYLYDDSGQPSVVTNAYGLEESYTYDARGRPLDVRSTNIRGNFAGPLVDDHVSWSPGSAVTRVERYGMGTSQNPRPTPETWIASRDSLGRLTNVQRNSSQFGTYNYDSGDRITGLNETGNSPSTTVYNFDQLVSRTSPSGNKTWAYDARGFATSDELRSSSGSLVRTRVHKWDALGRYASSSSGTNSTTYFYTPRGEIARVNKPTENDEPDRLYIGSSYSRTLSGSGSRRVAVIAAGRVVGELVNNSELEMSHRTFDGSVLAVTRSGATGTASVVRQEEFTPFGARLSGSGVGTASDHYQGVRRDELTVAGTRAYDSEDGVWLGRDPFPLSNPALITAEPRFANFYAANFNDPLKWRDPGGHNPMAIAGAAGAGFEALRQFIFEDEMDWGRVATVGAAAAAGGWIIGRVAALPSVGNHITRQIAHTVNSSAASVVASIGIGTAIAQYERRLYTASDLSFDAGFGMAFSLVGTWVSNKITSKIAAEPLEPNTMSWRWHYGGPETPGSQTVGVASVRPGHDVGVVFERRHHIDNPFHHGKLGFKGFKELKIDERRFPISIIDGDHAVVATNMGFTATESEARAIAQVLLEEGYKTVTVVIGTGKSMSFP